MSTGFFQLHQDVFLLSTLGIETELMSSQLSILVWFVIYL